MDNCLPRMLAASIALTSILFLVPPAWALEVEPDGVEMLPPGTTIALLYLQHAERNALYSGGHRRPGSPRLNSDLVVYRLVHSVGLAEGISWDAQVVMPTGRLKAAGTASALGEAHGVGYTMIGGPLKFRVNGNDIIMIGPYLLLPTGSYDRSSQLNMGENRWSLVLQLGYARRLSPKWSANFIGDAHFYRRNNDFRTDGASLLSQRPRYEPQIALRYAVTPQTELALGAGWIIGGRTKVGGVAQDDRLNTVYGRATITHFLRPELPVQLQLGRDLRVSSGFKEDWRMNVRLGLIF